MSEESKRANCGCRDREDIPHAINCPQRPATDEEIADTAARAKRVTGIGSVRALKLIARIDAERALNAEMLKMLESLVSAALTDSDACSICLHGTPGHLSGCTKASAEALIAKAKGKALPCRNCGCSPCAPTCVVADPVGRKK